jgi:hypothetical protein
MDDIKSACLRFEPVGSRVTCSPAPMDTDEDFLALVAPEVFVGFEQMLYLRGFQFGGSRIHAGGCLVGDESSFQSYTLGQTNMIVTASEAFFNRFMAATSIAKRLNLLDKFDRIALFQAVLYGAPDVPQLEQA